MVTIRNGIKNIYTDTKPYFLYNKNYGVVILKKQRQSCGETNDKMSTMTEGEKEVDSVLSQDHQLILTKTECSGSEKCMNAELHQKSNEPSYAFYEDKVVFTLKHAAILKSQNVIQDLKTTQLRSENYIMNLSAYSKLNIPANYNLCSGTKCKGKKKVHHELLYLAKITNKINSKAKNSQMMIKRKKTIPYTHSNNSKNVNLNYRKRIMKVPFFAKTRCIKSNTNIKQLFESDEGLCSGTKRTMFTCWHLQKKCYHKIIMNRLKSVSLAHKKENSEETKKKDNCAIEEIKSHEQSMLVTVPTVPYQGAGNSLPSMQPTDHLWFFKPAHCMIGKVEKLRRCRSEMLLDSMASEKTNIACFPSDQNQQHSVSSFVSGNSLHKKYSMNANFLKSNASAANSTTKIANPFKATFLEYSTANLKESHPELNTQSELDHLFNIIVGNAFLLKNDSVTKRYETRKVNLSETNGDWKNLVQLGCHKDNINGLMLSDYLGLGIEECSELKNIHIKTNPLLTYNGDMYTRRIEECADITHSGKEKLLMSTAKDLEKKNKEECPSCTTDTAQTLHLTCSSVNNSIESKKQSSEIGLRMQTKQVLENSEQSKTCSHKEINDSQRERKEYVEEIICCDHSNKCSLGTGEDNAVANIVGEIETPCKSLVKLEQRLGMNSDVMLYSEESNQLMMPDAITNRLIFNLFSGTNSGVFDIMANNSNFSKKPEKLKSLISHGNELGDIKKSGCKNPNAMTLKSDVEMLVRKLRKLANTDTSTLKHQEDEIIKLPKTGKEEGDGLNANNLTYVECCKLKEPLKQKVGISGETIDKASLFTDNNEHCSNLTKAQTNTLRSKSYLDEYVNGSTNNAPLDIKGNSGNCANIMNCVLNPNPVNYRKYKNDAYAFNAFNNVKEYYNKKVNKEQSIRKKMERNESEIDVIKNTTTRLFSTVRDVTVNQNKDNFVLKASDQMSGKIQVSNDLSNIFESYINRNSFKNKDYKTNDSELAVALKNTTQIADFHNKAKVKPTLNSMPNISQKWVSKNQLHLIDALRNKADDMQLVKSKISEIEMKSNKVNLGRREIQSPKDTGAKLNIKYTGPKGEQSIAGANRMLGIADNDSMTRKPEHVVNSSKYLQRNKVNFKASLQNEQTFLHHDFESSKKKLNDLRIKIQNHKNKLKATKYSADTIEKDRMHYDFSIKIKPDGKFTESAKKIQLSKLYNNVTDSFGERRPDSKVQEKLFEKFHKNIISTTTQMYQSHANKLSIQTPKRKTSTLNGEWNSGTSSFTLQGNKVKKSLTDALHLKTTTFNNYSVVLAQPARRSSSTGSIASDTFIRATEPTFWNESSGMTNNVNEQPTSQHVMLKKEPLANGTKKSKSASLLSVNTTECEDDTKNEHLLPVEINTYRNKTDKQVLGFMSIFSAIKNRASRFFNITKSTNKDSTSDEINDCYSNKSISGHEANERRSRNEIKPAINKDVDVSNDLSMGNNVAVLLSASESNVRTATRENLALENFVTNPILMKLDGSNVEHSSLNKMKGTTRNENGVLEKLYRADTTKSLNRPNNNHQTETFEYFIKKQTMFDHHFSTAYVDNKTTNRTIRNYKKEINNVDNSKTISREAHKLYTGKSKSLLDANTLYSTRMNQSEIDSSVTAQIGLNSTSSHFNFVNETRGEHPVVEASRPEKTVIDSRLPTHYIENQLQVENVVERSAGLLLHPSSHIHSNISKDKNEILDDFSGSSEEMAKSLQTGNNDIDIQQQTETGATV